ncbi:hypothetical protein WG66_008850 [Moniliophthora roreri]|nr:hypothetical protein WG66_008850 [Moniliophthora roreri]
MPLFQKDKFLLIQSPTIDSAPNATPHQAHHKPPPHEFSPKDTRCPRKKCLYVNTPQGAPGRYICIGCGKGKYKVTLEDG